MAVDAQGTGVASALVAAAEARLIDAGLANCQIEYEYTSGDPASERLYQWYEGALGFCAGGPPSTRTGCTEFRRCRKRLDKARRPTPRSPTSGDEPQVVSPGQAIVQTAPSWRLMGCSVCIRRLLNALLR